MGELEFLRIAESVLDVLEAAHSRGVIHRDLKPENLFLLGGSSGDPDKVRIKVLDFGLARLLQGQAITTYGLALGTPSFMSPEQAAGRLDEIDGRTDLFALGATGFRVRTGRRIHEALNAVELVTKMANMAAPPIAKFAPDASQPYARVIDRALQFRREDRYESAAAMRDDVRKAISGLEAGETATRLTVRAPPAPSAGVGEKTIEISERDLQSSSEPLELARLRPSPAPAPDPTSRSRVESLQNWPSDSISIPRRRSVLPWLVLLAAAGIGGKLWLDARKAPSTDQTGENPASSTVVLQSNAQQGAPLARDGGPDAIGIAQHNGSPMSAPRPGTMPQPPSSTFHGLPAPPPPSAPSSVHRPRHLR
jgi:serine/threonine-protein kinase